jgi:wyosine [tRNA(Phe)-imidazoG37] synthetase (radical SAM superfamily)
MFEEDSLIAFGPVPSRRLGKSLGVNNIPPKTCTYSCVYCQVGRTSKLQIARKDFYKPEKILDDVEKKVKDAETKGESIDYITFVSDGEPSLDRKLGEEIDILKSIGIKIAVITNASLLWMEDVKKDLHNADLVSVKIDAVSSDIWRKINRPQGSLGIDEILSGILEFSDTFHGSLVTETMIVQELNSIPEELIKISDFISRVHAHKSYLAVPTRPPAEKWVTPGSEYALAVAYHLFTERSINVEFLTDYEGNAFAFTGNVEDDLLSITAVHPMREDAIKEYLAKAKKDWEVVQKLMEEEKFLKVHYKDNEFYLRKFRR